MIMNESKLSCCIIIVTHNSEKHIHKAMECIRRQTYPAERIIIVDSGSSNPSYLLTYRQQEDVTIVLAQKDIGFCKGNNIGMSKLPSRCDYVFFLNPDAFLSSTFLEQAMAFMENPQNKLCGALTGMILGYDIQANKPTGMYDSTGVFQKWYGQWYDRSQGHAYQAGQYQKNEEVPAICGAVLFCRKTALDSVLIRENEVLDNTFYMYKEDIDLSIRLRKQGWKLMFLPELIAYHCRGWQKNRSKMPRQLRLASARNELRLHGRQKSPIPLAYSLLKYTAVKLLNL